MKYFRLHKPAIISLTVICLIFSTNCKNDNQNNLRPDQNDAIEKLIKQQQAQYNIPGMAVAIIKNGVVIKEIVSGFSNVSLKLPVTENTSFQLSSTTKTFTATAIMLLVNDGHLKLSDHVNDLLPGLPETWRNVTIRQLLSHTSGLPDITRTPGRLDLMADSWDSTLKFIYNAPLQFNPGEKWIYTQTNYVLLSMIIEKISGMPMEQFMEQRLFSPLKMQHTFFKKTDTTFIASNYEFNENNKGFVLRDLTFPQFVWAAGGLYSSLHDLILWSNALDSGKVLPKNLLDEMWAPTLLNNGKKVQIAGSIGYGLGWVVDDLPAQKSVGHSGGNSTAYRKYIDEKMTIIVLHNGVSDPEELITAIAAIMRSAPGAAAPSAQVELWDASKTGDTTAILKSLKNKANINLLDTRESTSGRRALNWAAQFNHPDVIRILLKNGAMIDAQNKTGFTALHHAAENGSLESAKVLLDMGANTNIINNSGNKPSETARSNNHPEVAAMIESYIKK